jgi:hypothetical protein
MMNKNWFMDYAEHAIRAIDIETRWYELRGWITKNGRHILIGEDESTGGAARGSKKLYSNGGAKPKKCVDKSEKSGIIKATEKQRKQFINEIKGTRAADGTVIKSMIPHSADRMIERGISPETVKDVLSNPTSIYPGNKPNRKCVQKGNIRLVYETSGLMITAIHLEDL